MSLNLNEIIESGILELYVLGQLNDVDTKTVEEARDKFPEVKHELFAIETALFRYDNIHKIKAPSKVLNNILTEISPKGSSINSTPQTKGKSIGWVTASLVLGLGLLGSLFYNFQQSKSSIESNELYVQQIKQCEQDKKLAQDNQMIMASILDLNSRKIVAKPTDKYPETSLVIYSNAESKKNFLQIDNLPPLADNQSYQLWSLKGDSAPIPLDVFETPPGKFIELRFVDDTNAYAITIEPKGGKDTPTLDNLIGVFSVSS